jgi:photosystem II stability/assembly factor-like uncharacterized protein
MKYLTFLIAFVFLINANLSGQTGWYQQSPKLPLYSLQDVYAIDSNNIIMVGNSGQIMKTIDGGDIWQVKSSGTSRDLMAVQFANLSTGLSVGRYGTILKTTDGGTESKSMSGLFIGIQVAPPFVVL